GQVDWAAGAAGAVAEGVAPVGVRVRPQGDWLSAVPGVRFAGRPEERQVDAPGRYRVVHAGGRRRGRGGDVLRGDQTGPGAHRFFRSRQHGEPVAGASEAPEEAQDGPVLPGGFWEVRTAGVRK